MRVRVDPEICAGFRVCIGVCPEVFLMHEDGFAEVQSSDVPPEFEDLVSTAANQCPSGAIFIVEGDG